MSQGGRSRATRDRAAAPLHDGRAVPDQPTRQALEATATLLQALSYPPRLQIALYVSRGESTPGDLSPQLAMKSTVLAHHLRHLRTAGVLRRHRQGSHVVYTIAPGVSQLLDAAFACAMPPNRAQVATATSSAGTLSDAVLPKA